MLKRISLYDVFLRVLHIILMKEFALEFTDADLILMCDFHTLTVQTVTFRLVNQGASDVNPYLHLNHMLCV